MNHNDDKLHFVRENCSWICECD